MQVLINPSANFHCYFDQLGSYGHLLTVTFLQEANLFCIGFLLYADRGGIKVWNVSMTTVVFCLYMYILETKWGGWDEFKDGPTCPADVIQSAHRTFWWLFVIWPMSALLCSIMDARKGSSGNGTGGSCHSIPSFNPLHYLKHAWDGTSSIWGKLAIIVFYVFIWLNIVGGIVSLILPSTSSLDYDCIYARVGGFGTLLSMMYYKHCNLFGVGFLLYADRGGIKVWNVILVTIVFGCYTWIMGPFHDFATITSYEDGPTCDLHTMTNGYQYLFHFYVTWPVVASILAILESRSSSDGSSSTGETAPLLSV